MKRIVVGATGASGIPILVKCLELIRESSDWGSALILSDGAKLTAGYECGDFAECGEDSEMEFSENPPSEARIRQAVEYISSLADAVYEPSDIAAAPASGTYQTAGMLIVPCSMKTLAGIHSGYADNLLLRAADVTIKEQRPLVLCVRETPLSPIHLRNMQELSILSGVHIVPPMLTFYHRPKSIDEMVYHIAAKLLEPFGIAAGEFRRWGETAV